MSQLGRASVGPSVPRRPCEDPAGLAAERQRGTEGAVESRRMLYYSIAIVVLAVLALLLVATY